MGSFAICAKHSLQTQLFLFDNGFFMRFNCNTEHGPVLVSSEITATGARVEVEWGPIGDAKKITYVFSSPLPAHALNSTVEEVAAQMAVSHFNETASPHPIELFFKFSDIKLIASLNLVPLV